jgi:hypothetical protein
MSVCLCCDDHWVYFWGDIGVAYVCEREDAARITHTATKRAPETDHAVGENDMVFAKRRAWRYQ